MLETMKNILRAPEDLHRIDAEVKALSETIHAHSAVVAGLSSAITLELAKTNDAHSLALGKMHADHAKFVQLRKDMEEELNALRHVRSHLEESISSRVSQQIEHTLSPHIDRLKTDVKQYNELKGTFTTLTLKMSEVSQAIDRLKTATQNIKESDGTYVQMARELLSQDQHKLDLMRKIEVLEGLISKERRRRNER